MYIKSIAIEGSDGAGKATTTKLLKACLAQNLGKKVGSVSFPRYKETVGGKLLYEVLKSERKDNYDFVSSHPKIASLIYVMDRVESKNYIQKLLDENYFLIFDRYISSNFIHQGGKISNDAEREKLISFLQRLEYVEFGLPEPDITFFLYLPTEIAMENKRKQRLAEGDTKPDAGEDDPVYLENSNKAGLWCCERLGWHKIDCFDQELGKQKGREEILEEILEVLGI